jgi:hypothetical protein
MSIGLIKQTAASVPTPPPTEENIFFDSADDKFKKKISTGAVIDLEGMSAGVVSFNTRTGAVVSISGDYTASQIVNVPSGSVSQTNVQAAIDELDSEKVPNSHIGSGGAQHADATILASGFISASDQSKLNGIAPGATANASDAFLLDRTNHTGTQLATTISDFNSSADARITAQKGAANGIAPLNGSSKIDATYLPAYVDDVLEYPNLAAFPITGSSGIIYIAVDTNKTYRWSGSVYVEISGPPANTDAVSEGVTNLYFTEPRVRTTPATGLPANDWNIVFATDTILQALGKLALQSTLSANTISSDATIPPNYTWIRQSKTVFAGTTKITIQAGAKLKFI